MANMIKLLLAVFAVQFTLIITGIAEMPFNAMYTFLANPLNWEASPFIITFTTIFSATVGGLFIFAGTFATRSDLFIFAAMAGIILSFGLPLASLWGLIHGQYNWIVATMLVSPIILMYAYTVISWWRGSA